MAGVVSVAGIGSVADARTGSVSGDIGTSHDPFISEIAAPETHGHNTIYLDSSISFEAYHWWANRSREAEKEFSTEAGLKQIWHAMVGKTIRKEKSPPVRIVGEGENDGVNDTKQNPAADSNEKFPSEKEPEDKRDVSPVDRWGVTESEWETANRATRTATWGTT